MISIMQNAQCWRQHRHRRLNRRS